MSRDRSGLRITRDVFFWIGTIVVVACLSVVVAGHTVFGSGLEQMPIPLSWILAGAAMIAFSFAEYCNAAWVTRAEPAATIKPVPPPEVPDSYTTEPSPEVLQTAQR